MTSTEQFNKKNRLQYENSPYLLEHSENPVDWYPWSDEAFEKARIESKIIFVSIGYSACHWCHVMRHECFENNEVAALLNESYISIKIDREERPDIDHQLQLSFQIMNGRAGGWPLSVFLTPDKRPFYSGTYFPLKSKYGMPGFIDVLTSVKLAYDQKQKQIEDHSQKLVNHLISINSKNGKQNEINTINSNHLIKDILRDFDFNNYGFGVAPKFPSETTLLLLLNEASRMNDLKGINAVLNTLDAMIQGGIYDQLGGGFHRYSVDQKWLVPHFEKMLYNQSLMVILIVKAFKISGNIVYKNVVRETLNYILREMISEGSFFSSQNADSEGIEGKFFVWSYSECHTFFKNANISDIEIEIFFKYYDITEEGNWENTNILHVSESPTKLADEYNFTKNEIIDTINKLKNLLVIKRNDRIKPTTDIKIITSWNALMAKAFILASEIFIEEPEQSIYLNIAKNNLDFLLENLFVDDTLYRIRTNSSTKIKGFLDDYQYFINALIEYFRVCMDKRYLVKAEKLFSDSINLFFDNSEYGFYYSLKAHDTIISRFKDYFDSPLPSGNSIAIENAVLINFFSNDNKINYHEIIKNTIINFENSIQKIDPKSISSFIYSKLLFQHNLTELTIITNSKLHQQLYKNINSIFIPFLLLIKVNIDLIDQVGNAEDWLTGKIIETSKEISYICNNYVCSKPLSTMDEMIDYLKVIFNDYLFNINLKE